MVYYNISQYNKVPPSTRQEVQRHLDGYIPCVWGHIHVCIHIYIYIYIYIERERERTVCNIMYMCICTCNLVGYVPCVRGASRSRARVFKGWSNNNFNNLHVIMFLELNITITCFKWTVDHAAETSLVFVNCWSVGCWNYSNTRASI